MKNNNKGFSLVEMIVSVAVMSLIMIIATTMISNASRYFEKQAAMVELQNEAQLVTNYLSEAIMEATDMEFIYDSSTGSGVYKLYKTDSKGNQRIMYYDNATTSLYMVTFKDNAEPVPEAYSDIGFLVSDEVQGIHVTFDCGYSTSPEEIPTNADGTPVTPTAADGTPITPELVVKNPLKVKIVFQIAHNGVSGEFEISANCRNTLDDIVITADGVTTTYKAYSR